MTMNPAEFSTKEPPLTLIANTIPVPTAVPTPSGSPMAPPLHTEPKSSDEIRQEFQELKEIGNHLPEGPLRAAHGTTMKFVEPIYERAAQNAELREDLETEGREAFAELFGNVRTATINLIGDLLREANQGANAFVQWIKDRVEDIQNLATVVENKFPGSDSNSTPPVDTSELDPGQGTSIPTDKKVVGMDGKPIPQSNEDHTMPTTGGMPLEQAHASDFVVNISSRAELRFLLGSMPGIPGIERSHEQIGLSRNQLAKTEAYILDMNNTEMEKIKFLSNMGIEVPKYGGVTQATLRYLKNPPSSEVSLRDYLIGDMVNIFKQNGQHASGIIDLSILNLSGMYLPDGADLTGVNFTGTDLSNAKLPRVNLVGSNLTQADLSNAYLASASLFGVFAHGADFSRANLVNANLTGGDFTGSRFSDSNITLGNFSNANLTNTDWRPLNSENATYMNFDANFTGANSTGILKPNLRPNYPF